jgi:hypothetical protein
MAFSATVRGSAYMGAALRVTYGDWSGASGDAAGTISVPGRYLGSLWFKNDTTTVNANTSQAFPVVNWDGNAAPGALTVQNQDNVTNGSFLLFSLGQ